ncbi:hypothetical protein ACM9XD_18715 [Xanthomonas sacchari]
MRKISLYISFSIIAGLSFFFYFYCGRTQEVLNPASVNANEAYGSKRRASFSQATPQAKGFPSSLQAAVALKSLAEKGSGAAACELVALQLYCRDVSLQGRTLSADLRRGGISYKEVKGREDEWEKKASYCHDDLVLSDGEYLKYLRKAAQAGYPRAQSLYALGSFFDPENMLGNLDEVRAYRTDGVRIAEQAASSGDIRVAYELASSYAGYRTNGNEMLAQVSGRNDARALEIFLALRDVYRREAIKNPLSIPMRDVIEVKIRDIELKGRSAVNEKSGAPFFLTPSDKSYPVALSGPAPGLDMCR